MSEKTEMNHVVEVAALVIVVLVVVPIVINVGLWVVATIVTAFQPKTYEMTMTFPDGHQEIRRGTKEELREYLKMKGMHFE